MIKECFEQYFERVDVKFHNVVALKMSKALVEVDRNISVVAGYIPPQDSSAYSESDNVMGTEILEQCVLALAEDVYIMMCGDFNARIGSQNSLLDTEKWPRNSTDKYFLNRFSQDSVEKQVEIIQ